LYRQAAGAVRWVETVLEMKARGVGIILECGPGKVLAGATRRIDAALVSGNISDPATLAQTRELLA
jgi:[acyl-carrier-protein] S-malonyltransferase